MWSERRRGSSPSSRSSCAKGTGREGQPPRAGQTLVSTGRLVASGLAVCLYFVFWCFEKEVVIGLFPPTLVSHSKHVIPVLWALSSDTACYWAL